MTLQLLPIVQQFPSQKESHANCHPAGQDLGGGPTNFGRPKVQKAQVPLCFTIQSRDFDQMHHSKMTPPMRERKPKAHIVKAQ